MPFDLQPIDVLLLVLLALAALLVSLARPQALALVPKEQATIVLVMDVSGSMNADDVEPTRMEAAQRAASRFLDRLPARFQVGLVIFSSEAETLVPPTTDREAVRAALAHPGPALVDVMVNPDEPPMPGKVSYDQAKGFAQAFLRGQPHRATIASTLFRDKLDQLKG